jgi:hypothetical protein
MAREDAYYDIQFIQSRPFLTFLKYLVNHHGHQQYFKKNKSDVAHEKDEDVMQVPEEQVVDGIANGREDDQKYPQNNLPVAPSVLRF